MSSTSTTHADWSLAARVAAGVKEERDCRRKANAGELLAAREYHSFIGTHMNARNLVFRIGVGVGGARHRPIGMTAYEGRETSCRRWHGHMTDIAEQR